MAMKISINTALFCGQFAISIMHTFFMFYYVKIFLNIFKIDEYIFNLSQIFLIVWNSINDPIFGYIQVHFFFLLQKLIILKFCNYCFKFSV